MCLKKEPDFVKSQVSRDDRGMERSANYYRHKISWLTPKPVFQFERRALFNEAYQSLSNHYPMDPNLLLEMGILKNQCENRAFPRNGFKINHAVIDVNNSVDN